MTPLYDHIGCCVEHDSSGSVQTLNEARRLRPNSEGQLTLVHVIMRPTVYPALEGGAIQTWLPDGMEYLGTATNWLSALADDGEQIVVLEGHPAGAVCDWAAANGVDLLVAASHRGRVERALLGSFAGYLGRHSPCPVLLVRPIATEQTPVPV